MEVLAMPINFGETAMIVIGVNLCQKPSLSLNKVAVAEVYLRAGKPWKAIRALESPAPVYNPCPQREQELLEQIKSDYPDWEFMEKGEIKPAKWQQLLCAFGLR